MVRFQAASGNNAAKLAARGKHYVLFDEPADLGAKLKETYPDLGWAPSKLPSTVKPHCFQQL